MGILADRRGTQGVETPQHAAMHQGYNSQTLVCAMVILADRRETVISLGVLLVYGVAAPWQSCGLFQ